MLYNHLPLFIEFPVETLKQTSYCKSIPCKYTIFSVKRFRYKIIVVSNLAKFKSLVFPTYKFIEDFQSWIVDWGVRSKCVKCIFATVVHVKLLLFVCPHPYLRAPDIPLIEDKLKPLETLGKQPQYRWGLKN